jgi:hypothetical protein
MDASEGTDGNMATGNEGLELESTEGKKVR